MPREAAQCRRARLGLGVRPHSVQPAAGLVLGSASHLWHQLGKAGIIRAGSAAARLLKDDP